MTHELMKISKQGLLQTEPTIHTKTQTLIPNNTLRNAFFYTSIEEKRQLDRIETVLGAD